MEAPAEAIGGSNDISHIVKGKRTKRLRPTSPIPFTITSHSSADGGGDVDGQRECITIANNDNNNNLSSPLATATKNFLDVPTKEDEETAKCLVLLSQCDDRRKFTESSPHKFDLFSADLGLYKSKFNSKRYIETSISTENGGKVGAYVYECKTCNRTFPSFQALGGHRTSHKKPKTLTINKPCFNFSDQDEPSPTSYKNNNITKLSPLSPLPIQFNNINVDKSSPRIHQCSYCGAEFTSGQALGGHMRRHRGVANTTLCLSPLSPAPSIESSDHQQHHLQESANTLKRSRSWLSLDLNLPAPEVPKEKQDQEQIQKQPHEHEQTALVLSNTPKLIDCHF